MGALFSFSEPTLPIAVKEIDLINGDEAAVAQFRHDYRSLGVAVLEMDEKFFKIATEYRTICGKWFSDNNFTEKKKYIAESKDELFKELGRRPNIGYILTDNKKEYLKFKVCSSQDMFPTKEIYTKFKQLFTIWNNAGMTCMETILSEPVQKTQNTQTETKSNDDKNDHDTQNEEKLPDGFEALTSKQDRENIRKFGSIHASISLIHYFDKICEKDEEEKLNENDKLKNRTLEVPLGIHVDTGLMTFVTCSDQYGLEVLDRKTNQYFYPEKVFDPKKHIFVMAGRKMELFTWKKVIKPSWHAVRVPLDKDRNSLLYFLEIQKDH